MQVRNGGLMTSKSGSIGQFAGSHGTVTVGSGGQWTIDNSTLSPLMVGDAGTADEAFNFSSTAGNAFSGTVDLSNATLDLSGVNTSALTSAILKANVGSITTVADGEQTIGGLTFAGGEMVFNATAPDGKVADSHVTVGTLDATGNSTVQIIIPETYVPDHETDTRASLMSDQQMEWRSTRAGTAGSRSDRPGRAAPGSR